MIEFNKMLELLEKVSTLNEWEKTFVADLKRKSNFPDFNLTENRFNALHKVFTKFYKEDGTPKGERKPFGIPEAFDFIIRKCGDESLKKETTELKNKFQTSFNIPFGS